MKDNKGFLGQAFFSIPLSYIKDFKKSKDYINIQRIRFVIFVLIALAIFLLLSDLRLLRSADTHPLHIFYVYMDITMLVVMSSFITLWHLNIPKSAAEISRFHNVFIHVFSAFVMFWCAIVGGLEYLIYGGFSTYIIGAFAVAAILYLNGMFLILVYLLSLGLFLLVISQLNSSPVSFLQNHISLVPLISFSWFISRFFYSSLARNFVFREQISEKNEELNHEIGERKRVESALQKAHTELEKRVQERTSQLSEANERLNNEISFRKKAAKDLSESEEKYRTLFEDSLEAIILTRDAKILDVNPAWLKLHGFQEKQEVLGKDATEFIQHKDLQIPSSSGQVLSDRGQQIFQQKDIRKDGSIVDVEICSSLISLGDTETVLETIRDISEQKRLERERELLETKLRRSEKMEVIGVLAGGVAHDLNNILGGIVSYPELLLMDLPEDSHLRDPIQTIHRSGQKAATIVQDLLTLARRGVAITEPVNLNQIILDFLESPECQKIKSFHPEVEIETNIEEGLLNILGSRVHLSKTIMNLVSNGAEAMSGGGKIIIRTENRYVDSAIKGYEDIEEGDYAVVEISDTGEGILPEDMGKIFEPFYTKKVMGRSGTGLGMAVVWSTVKDHHGFIDIRSPADTGTTFTLYFPVSKEELVKGDKKLRIGRILGKGESVLVIDDIEEQRKIALNILNRLGYSPTSVSSGEEAIDFLKDNSVDLLLLDMIMDPGMNGLETYRKILELHPGQKAIIVSGFSETRQVKEVQGLGAGQYVKKPYSLEKIGMAIRLELEKID